VAVFRNTFLQPSEVWIHSNLVAQERYESRVFCRRRLHSDRFPFPTSAIRDPAQGRDGPGDRAAEAAYALFRSSPTLQGDLEAFGPDLFHAHFGVDGVYALPFARRMNRPLLVSVYGYDASRLPRFQLLPVAWFNYWLHFDALVRGTTRFLAYTKFLADQLEARGVPREKITVHYPGVPTDRYAVERPAGERPPNVLFVGRFVEKKGLPDLVRAFGRVAGVQPQARLVLVGDGPLRPDLERLVGRLALGSRVDLPGFLDQDDLRDRFEQAAVFCHPSVTPESGETEGLPFSVLEAQAAGLPVVATRHAGLPEGVEDGETGILVGEGDVGGLARALGALLGNPERRETMSRAAVDHVIRKFDLRRQAARLEALYDEILSK
jgi:glycosyltransferase involved in cell wall biosynthesis